MRVQRWCVYRCFDTEGRLLYVGSSSNVENRIAGHLSPAVDSPTSLELQRLYDHHTVVNVATRAEAMDMERLTITQEAPLLNRQCNPQRWRNLDRRWFRVEDPIYTEAESARLRRQGAALHPVSIGLADVVARELSARGHTTLRARAAATGIKPSTLDRRLQGRRPFKFPELVRVADALGMSLSELAAAAERAA